jgi:hypothetical protein
MSRNRTPVDTLSSDALTGATRTEAGETDNSLDREVGLSGDMTIEDIVAALNKPGAADIDSPDFKSMADELAFMNEMVAVRIHESTDKNAEKIIFVSNDGTPQRFVRGQYVAAKRKYVEVLARAKPFSVATPETFDGNGDRTTSIRTTVGLMYPFDMQDRNPRGQAWLQRVLAEA